MSIVHCFGRVQLKHILHCDLFKNKIFKIDNFQKKKITQTDFLADLKFYYSMIKFKICKKNRINYNTFLRLDRVDKLIHV